MTDSENITCINCTEITPDNVELILVECNDCGFHLGIDAEYLRNHNVVLPCPNCRSVLTIKEIE
jgi:DNA-directed RNA polymerase subunit RPC12/RpoP